MSTNENQAGAPGCLVLLCEGNPDPRWQRPFIQLCLKLRGESSDNSVMLAFIQDTEPSLMTAVRKAAGEGFNAITILPMLLSLDETLEREIPRQIVAARQALPGLEIMLLPPLGEYPQVASAIQAVVENACGGSPGTQHVNSRQRFILLSTSADKRGAEP